MASEHLLNILLAKRSPNEIMKESAYQGKIDIIKLLLDRKLASPSIEHDYPLRMASLNGHIEIVKILLQQKKVNVYAKKSVALHSAIHNGHIDIVKLLLQYIKTKIYVTNSAVIALKNGHLNVVELLLSKKLIDSNEIFSSVAQYGYMELVKSMLKQRHKNGKFVIQCNHIAISKAIENGQPDIAKLLIQAKNDNGSPRFCSNYNSGEALYYAVVKNYIDIIELLLDNSSINLTSDNYYIIRKAVQDNNYDALLLLLQHKNINRIATLKYLTMHRYNYVLAERVISEIVSNKIKKMIHQEKVKSWLLKYVVYHPNSVYILRLIDEFQYD
jgi:ankyrin repeat protein